MEKEKIEIDLEELEKCFQLIEAERELVYHLKKYKEALELRNKELEDLCKKAQRVMLLKRYVKKGITTLKKEEKEYINKLFGKRFIKI